MLLFPVERLFVMCGKRLTTIEGSLFSVSKPAFKWCSAMLFLGSPFLVACLCSFSGVVKFLGVTDISGLVVGAFEIIINCSRSVLKFVFVLNINE